MRIARINIYKFVFNNHQNVYIKALTIDIAAQMWNQYRKEINDTTLLGEPISIKTVFDEIVMSDGT